MVDFSIIVVSYRSIRDLPVLLGTVDDAVAGATWHATIVNNAVDDPLDAITHSAHVSVIEAGANLGYSGGINLGLSHAPDARWTVFLNPDLLLRPGSLARLAEALQSGAAAAVPLIVDDHGRRQHSLRREPGVLSAAGEACFGDSWAGRPQNLAETVRNPFEYDRAHPIDWATGAVLAVRSDVVKGIGRWDESLFFMYSEETDYARRIRSAGGIIQFVPEAIVEHRGGGSGSSPKLDALLEVNKLRYFRKWHGPVAAGAFGAILVLRNAVRPHRPGARAATRALLSRRERATLPGGLR